MPSSFGLWFGAYAESLVDDLTIIQAAYRQDWDSKKGIEALKEALKVYTEKEFPELHKFAADDLKEFIDFCGR